MSPTSFRVNPQFIVCLYDKELLARSRCHIWCLSDSNKIWTHNHLVRKRTLNHLAKLAKKASFVNWFSVCLRTKWLWVWILLQSLPSEHLSSLEHLLNLITATTKMKQEVYDDLSVCIDERSPCGLSIIWLINVMWSKGNYVTTPNGGLEGLLLRSCFYCPNLSKISPSVTIDEKICQTRDYEVMMSLSLEAEYSIEPFE